MENQITIPQVREVLKLTKKIAPVLNQTEFNQLMLLYADVLDRYEKQEHSGK